jgi:hypothetical protein
MEFKTESKAGGTQGQKADLVRRARAAISSWPPWRYNAAATLNIAVVANLIIIIISNTWFRIVMYVKQQRLNVEMLRIQVIPQP